MYSPVFVFHPSREWRRDAEWKIEKLKKQVSWNKRLQVHCKIMILVGFIKEGKVGNSLTMFLCSIAGVIVNLCVSILLIALLTSQRGFV